MTVKVDPSRLANLSNTATVSSTTTDPNPGDESASEATQVNTAADLHISKSDSPDPVLAGNNLTYTITVTNNGPADARTARLAVDVRAAAPFVSADAGGTNTAGTVSWSLGDLGLTSATVHLVVNVDPARLANLSNTANVSSTTTDPNPGDESASEATTVNTQADLEVGKSASPDPGTAGTDEAFTLTVHNNGPSDSAGYTLSDPLPALTSFVSAPGCSYDSGSNTVNCTAAHLAYNATDTYTVTVHIASNFPNGGNLQNTASLTAEATSDIVNANNSATSNTTVNRSADVADLKVATPSPVIAGNQLTFKITVTNNGPSDAEAVVLHDVLDPALQNPNYCVDSSGTCTPLANPWPGSNDVALGSMAAGSTQVVTIVATVDAGTTETSISNTATVSSPTNDPTPGNNSSSTTTPVATSADLSITKSDSPDPVLAGNNLTYTVTVTNAGPSFARNVVISDPVPRGTTYVSSDQGGVNNSGTVSWTIGDLAPGAVTVHMTVKVNPDQLANLSNTATVSSTTTDPSPGDHSATETTTVNTAADLSITNSDSPDPVLAGNNLTYTITVSNAGPSFARNVQVSD